MSDDSDILANPHVQWPRRCEDCGYEFEDDDYRSISTQRIYVRPDTGSLMLLRDAPPGAMYYAPWYDRLWKPQLQHVIVVILPDRTPWPLDSMASNCNLRSDTHMEQHHCWVISGVAPYITISQNGLSCGGGEGSVRTPNWYGRLIGGFLEPIS